MPTTFTLSGTLKLQPKWVEAFGVTDVIDSATISHTAALLDGSGSGQANAFWKDQLTVAAGGSVSLDLRALTHKAFGGTGTLTFAAVKMLVVQSTAAVAVGATHAERWPGLAGGAINVGAGGVAYALAPDAGYPVASGASVVVITNSGSAPAVVDIYIAGVQAT